MRVADSASPRAGGFPTPATHVRLHGDRTRTEPPVPRLHAKHDGLTGPTAAPPPLALTAAWPRGTNRFLLASLAAAGCFLHTRRPPLPGWNLSACRWMDNRGQ